MAVVLPTRPFGDLARSVRQVVLTDDLTLEVEYLASPEALANLAPVERCALGFDEPFGAVFSADLWGASVALAREIAVHPDWISAHSRVLELGCGATAIPSIMAARYRGCHVTCSDLSPHAVALALNNGIRNKVRVAPGPLSADPPPGGMEGQVLDWLEPETWLPEERRRFDLVMAADTIYEDRLQLPLCRSAHAHLRPGGELLVVGCLRSVERWLPDHAVKAGFEPLGRYEDTVDWGGVSRPVRFERFRKVSDRPG